MGFKGKIPPKNEFFFMPPLSTLELEEEFAHKIQLVKLQELIAYLKKRSPFYREKLSGIEPQDIKELSDLEKLPLTSRSDLESRNRDFLCLPESKISDYCRTSGTTGKPLYIGMSYQDLKRAAESCAEFVPFMDLGKVPRFALLLPLDELINPSICLERTFRDVLKRPVYRIGAGHHPRIMEYLRDLKPTVVLATPYLLHALCRKFSPSGLALQKAVLLGQPVRGENWRELEIKKQIEAAWGLEVYSAYGSSEMFSGFFECRAHRGHHIQWLDMMVEILHPQTAQPLLAGEVGEVTVTTLSRRGMPLLRYQTRDLSRMERGSCSCGANSPRVMEVLGRKDHFLKIKGTGLFPQQIENVLLKYGEVDNFLIQVVRDDAGQDCLKLLAASARPGAESRLRQLVKRELLVTPQVEILPPEEILRRQAARSRKPQRFQDLRGDEPR